MIAALLLAVAVLAHDAGYSTALATHLVRWLKAEEIPAKVITPSGMEAALKGEKIAFLIGFDEPSAAELDILRSFRATGGKLVVFHSASPKLGELMGVRPLGYRAQPKPGAWSKMKFVARRPEGFPAEILQTSSVLQRAAPIKGKGRVVAEWCDRNGDPTGDAAWIVTPGGYWMTHVLLADGDEHLKARLVAAMCRSADPGLWDPVKADLREAEYHRQTKALALRQVPRKGEIHAVWEHSGCGLYPGDWPRTMRLLAEARVTDLFLNVAGAGFAHYPSEVLPRSKIFRDEGDQLAAALAAAEEYGIRVHAWILCFTATRGSPETIARFRDAGETLKTKDGAATEYLDPSKAKVRALLIRAIDEIQAKYPALAGVHLDFVRWYERAAKPKDAAAIISGFVAEARIHVRHPKWLTAAVLGKYPSCVTAVGQDWDGWLDSNLVDYVVPMNYTENRARYASYVAQQGALRSHAAKTISGIGVTANESRLKPHEVIEQINLARERNLAGVALFDLDVVLQKRVLPYLKLGIW